MTMGQRIAEERKKLNLSQEALGEKMGVSRQAISKWESDGAVPDVDKLIALSKLFGVTVGWLLGVEEAPRSDSADGFTDAQLKMVEEIVKRYQPQTVQPEQKPKHRVLKTVAALAAVIIAYTAWSDLNQRLDQNVHSINGLNSTYYTIQSQLSIVSSRLGELLEGEKLLAGYEASGTAWDDNSGADITLTLIPKAWAEGDSAWIAVRVDNEDVGTFPCEQGSNQYTALVSLEGRNGYEYYYVVRHADGTQEQQELATGYANIKSKLTGSWEISCAYNTSANKLEFTGFDLYFCMPELGKAEPVYLTRVDWVVYVNGEEYCREEAIVPESLGYGNVSCSGSGLRQFALPECEDGDVVVFGVEVTLSDGTVMVVEDTRLTWMGHTWQTEKLTETPIIIGE